ncbi:hypothetical protein OY671_010252, partial [Metschnikowia pulcherrima]
HVPYLRAMKRAILATSWLSSGSSTIAYSRGVSPYSPLHSEPEMEAQIERVSIQAVRMFGIPWSEDRCTGYQAGAVDTESGARIQAELFVGADGAASPSRTAAGLKHDAVSYNDTGSVVNSDAERAHQGTAFQWFRDDGVSASSPSPDTADGPQVSMVWSMRSEQARELSA